MPFLCLDEPVSERSDDKALRTSEKLVLILKVDVGDRYHALVRLLDVVEPRLLLPLKVDRRLYVLGTLQRTISVITSSSFLILLNQSANHHQNEVLALLNCIVVSI